MLSRYEPLAADAVTPLRQLKPPYFKDLPSDELYLSIANVMTRSGHCREWVMARIADGSIPAIRVRYRRTQHKYVIPESSYMLYAYSIQPKEKH